MQISDDLYLGPALLPSVSDGPSLMSQGVGPMGRVYVWDAVPLTLQTAGLRAAAASTGAVDLALTAGTGVTLVTRPDGSNGYVLDVPRCVTVTAAGANTATLIVYGFDQYGQALSQALAAPSTSTVATLKAFKVVTRIAISGTAGSNISCGFNDSIGLPLRLLTRDYIVAAVFNETAVALSAFTKAVTTSPATTATGDVRGVFALPSAADGTKRLVVTIALPALACGPNATRIGAAGVDQV